MFAMLSTEVNNERCRNITRLRHPINSTLLYRLNDYHIGAACSIRSILCNNVNTLVSAQDQSPVSNSIFVDISKYGKLVKCYFHLFWNRTFTFSLYYAL